MTAVELVRRCSRGDPSWQREVNAFVDAYRRADVSTRVQMTQDEPNEANEMAGLVSAVVSALCREVGTDPPPWVARVGSPTPFFPFPARGYAMRVRLMVESPPPFRIRNVFVPSNYLSRA